VGHLEGQKEAISITHMMKVFGYASMATAFNIGETTKMKIALNSKHLHFDAPRDLRLFQLLDLLQDPENLRRVCASASVHVADKEVDAIRFLVSRFNDSNFGASGSTYIIMNLMGDLCGSDFSGIFGRTDAKRIPNIDNMLQGKFTASCPGACKEPDGNKIVEAILAINKFFRQVHQKQAAITYSDEDLIELRSKFNEKLNLGFGRTHKAHRHEEEKGNGNEKETEREERKKRRELKRTQARE
jgi:hypothetical protein